MTRLLGLFCAAFVLLLAHSKEARAYDLSLRSEAPAPTGTLLGAQLQPPSPHLAVEGCGTAFLGGAVGALFGGLGGGVIGFGFAALLGIPLESSDSAGLAGIGALIGALVGAPVGAVVAMLTSQPSHSSVADERLRPAPERGAQTLVSLRF